MWHFLRELAEESIHVQKVRFNLEIEYLFSSFQKVRNYKFLYAHAGRPDVLNLSRSVSLRETLPRGLSNLWTSAVSNREKLTNVLLEKVPLLDRRPSLNHPRLNLRQQKAEGSRKSTSQKATEEPQAKSVWQTVHAYKLLGTQEIESLSKIPKCPGRPRTIELDCELSANCSCVVFQHVCFGEKLKASIVWAPNRVLLFKRTAFKCYQRGPNRRPIGLLIRSTT